MGSILFGSYPIDFWHWQTLVKPSPFVKLRWEEGHYQERKGKNKTWLISNACSFLSSATSSIGNSRQIIIYLDTVQSLDYFLVANRKMFLVDAEPKRASASVCTNFRKTFNLELILPGARYQQTFLS